jgi:uncharacterized protein YceH (UPF0502 family)
MSMDTPTAESPPSPKWRPLEGIERRVLGVLIEKAKTTPDAYPLSLNALRSGCNQKNNRAPLMQLEEDHIEDALESLRKSGAVAVVQGEGRVDRYRHLAYDWLSVDKVELAVMAELLLRGSQTVGELRGRAARMEPIKGLTELQPILDSLQSKNLIQYLTPPGRGSVVTHTLYLDREMDKVRREAGVVAAGGSPVAPPAAAPAARASESSWPAPVVFSVSAPMRQQTPAADDMREELAALRNELAAVRLELGDARAEFTAATATLRRDLDQLNQQLGN